MKIQYFPDTDTLYIDLSNRQAVASETMSENLIVDVDSTGKPTGITIEHYSKTADSTTIETILPLATGPVAASI